MAALTRALRNEPALANIEEKSTQHMESAELWKAVQTLSTSDQHIVYLRYFLDLSVNETAEALQIPEGTVKSRLSRAIERLRRIIQQEFPVLIEGHDV
jgi:RNA polymerase sigma-70 factor (ECF subfamily)